MATKKKATKATMKKKPATKMAAAPKKPVEITVPKIRAASKPRNSNTLTYTQSEVVENIRGFLGIPKRSKAKELCQDLASFLVDSLKKGYKVPFLGICKLQVRTSKPRMGRNPKTGEPMHIPARKRVRFTATKALKQAVL